MGAWTNLMIESQSPRYCYSTEDYNEKRNDYTNIIEKKVIPDWFYLPYCDECEKYIEFVNNIRSNHRSHRPLVTCNYCLKDFKTFNKRQLGYSSCCRLNERKIKTYTFEKLGKLANVYNIKRRRTDYIIDDLVQKVENYIL